MVVFAVVAEVAKLLSEAEEISRNSLPLLGKPEHLYLLGWLDLYQVLPDERSDHPTEVGEGAFQIPVEPLAVPVAFLAPVQFDEDNVPLGKSQSLCHAM